MREGSGIAIAVASAILAFFATLAFILAPLTFAFLFVYAIVKSFGSSTAHASATTVLLGVVIIVATLTVALTCGIALLGRSMTPKKRGRDGTAR